MGTAIAIAPERVLTTLSPAQPRDAALGTTIVSFTCSDSITGEPIPGSALIAR